MLLSIFWGNEKLLHIPAEKRQKSQVAICTNLQPFFWRYDETPSYTVTKVTWKLSATKKLFSLALKSPFNKPWQKTAKKYVANVTNFFGHYSIFAQYANIYLVWSFVCGAFYACAISRKKFLQNKKTPDFFSPTLVMGFDYFVLSSRDMICWSVATFYEGLETSYTPVSSIWPTLTLSASGKVPRGGTYALHSKALAHSHRERRHQRLCVQPGKPPRDRDAFPSVRFGRRVNVTLAAMPFTLARGECAGAKRWKQDCVFIDFMLC